MSDHPDAETETGHPLSRRSVLASSAALAAAVGPLGVAADSSGADRGAIHTIDLLDVVPEDATTLAHLLGEDLEEEAYGRLLEAVGGVETGTVDVGASYPAFEDATGIGPWETTELLQFVPEGASEDGAESEDQETEDDSAEDADQNGDGDETGGDGTSDDEEDEAEPGRYLVDVDLTEEEFRNRIASETATGYQRVEYEGRDVLYEPAGEDALAFATLGDGQYAVGPREAVTAVLDVRYGDARSVEDVEGDDESDAPTAETPFVDAVEEVRDANLSVTDLQEGPIVPEEYRDIVDLEEVEAVSRSYDLLESEGSDGDAETDDGEESGEEIDGEEPAEVDLRLLLWPNDREDVEAVRDDLEGVLGVLRDLAEDEETQEALREVEIDHHERRGYVEVRYQGDLERVETLLNQV